MKTPPDLGIGESLTRVNDNICLIESQNGLRFGTDALMLAGYINRVSGGSGVELGAGSGIISLLCAARLKFSRITAVEIQPAHAEILKRNIHLNSLEDKVTSVCADVRNIKEYFPEGDADAVFSNPPYMRTDSGKANLHDEKNIARHEVNGGISDFCTAAKAKLKYGGYFYVVYRPDRLCDLLTALRDASLEPKELTFVSAYPDSEPSMVLVRARYGGASGMRVSRQFFIYKSRETANEYSEDMKYLLEQGEFPNMYK